MSTKEVMDPEELISQEDISGEETAEEEVDEIISEVTDESLDEIDDGQAPGSEPESEPTPESELDQAKAEVSEYKDRMTRVQAEMDNLRKRTARDIQNAHKFALESFARELLSVTDSMDLGLTAARDADDIASIIEGIELTSKQLFGVLEKFNVEVMDAQGVRFDPEQHEAMTMVPNPDMEPNTVMDVVQKGYTLNGRLLRPARVIVSS